MHIGLSRSFILNTFSFFVPWSWLKSPTVISSTGGSVLYYYTPVKGNLLARKKDSKAIWVGGLIHAAFGAKLKEEGWTWGLTKKVESLLQDYATGKLIRSQPADYRYSLQELKVDQVGEGAPPKRAGEDQEGGRRRKAK